MIHLRPYGIIYLARNNNTGKVYIGQTRQFLSERVGDHKRKAEKYESKSHFHSSIRKHGFESFSWTIIDTAENREELNEKEKMWIENYSSASPSTGYNLTKGGDSFEFTEEAKIKIGLSSMGRKLTAKQLEARSIAMAGSGNNFYGKRHTDEAKKINRDAHIGKKLKPEHIAKCIHYGESNPRAVFTASQVKDIRQFLSIGFSIKPLAIYYGVSRGAIYMIKTYRTWKQITI